MAAPPTVQAMPETKRKLLEAAVRLMRRLGYNATTVDLICAEAKVTKGSFFHYFKYKEEIAEAAMEYFCARQEADMMRAGGFAQLKDPLARVHGLLDHISAHTRECAADSCLVGNLTQEIALTHPAIQECGNRCLGTSINNFAVLLRAAKEAHPPAVDFDPDALATLLIAILQGSAILAKAQGSSDAITSNIEQFRDHLTRLFGKPRPKAAAKSASAASKP